MSNVVTPNNKDLSADQVAETPRNIFEDPAIAAAAKNDPFVRFVLKNARIIFIALAAIALAMIAYDRFTTTQQQRKAQLTQDVRDIQKDYEALVGKLDELATLKATEPSAADKVKTVESEVQQIKERGAFKLTALEASGAFPEIARLYSGLIAARTGDLEKAKAALSASSWELAPADSSERMVAELTTFALAKSLIDSEANRNQARQALSSIAERGTFAAAQSVLALGTLARTEEEKAQVQKLAEEVSKRLPLQRKYLLSLSDD